MQQVTLPWRKKKFAALKGSWPSWILAKKIGCKSLEFNWAKGVNCTQPRSVNNSKLPKLFGSAKNTAATRHISVFSNSTGGYSKFDVDGVVKVPVWRHVIWDLWTGWGNVKSGCVVMRTSGCLATRLSIPRLTGAGVEAHSRLLYSFKSIIILTSFVFTGL